jgi:hypothetical protein
VVGGWLTERAVSKRRKHDLRNVLRLAFGLVGAVGLAGVVTERWLGVRFSLGVVGEEMERNVERYRQRLAETAVELEVQSRPTVNVEQETSWVKLKLRYIVNPRRGQRTKNELYERILAAFNEHPDRVKFPVSRNR